jgi:hypothetical protein
VFFIWGERKNDKNSESCVFLYNVNVKICQQTISVVILIVGNGLNALKIGVVSVQSALWYIVCY